MAGSTAPSSARATWPSSVPTARSSGRIADQGQNPTNVAWGPDGDHRLFVTEHELGQIEIFETDTTALPLYYGGPERVRL